MQSLFLFCFALIMALPALASQPYSVEQITAFELKGAITPASLNLTKKAIHQAKQKGSQLLLIELNTPGGLISTTKEILALIGESDIPVAVWIAPEGASATSAGAIIASAAHILVAGAGTNIGAATPVQMGGDIKDSDLKAKAVNDLVALVQSLSEARGRDPKGFGEMISKAKSYTSSEALEKNLIDAIVNDQKEFLAQIHNRIVTVKGQPLQLTISGNVVSDRVQIDTAQELLTILADPALAYILFLIGAALIYFELQAPGGFIAGSIGALSLILAGIGFQVLPLNLGAFALIILAIILLVLEFFVTSMGILLISGLASLVVGSMYLYQTDDSYLEFSRWIIFGAVSSLVVFSLLIGFFISRDHKNIGRGQFNKLEGQRPRFLNN
jgi:membrane-bound serine protease (ClpP class)